MAINANLIQKVTESQTRDDIPEFRSGDEVAVHVKIREGEKERIQIFQGFVLKRVGGGVSETFTVRKISFGVGVEKTFLLNSPIVAKVEVLRLGKVRQATIFYMRELKGKAARIKERK